MTHDARTSPFRVVKRSLLQVWLGSLGGVTLLLTTHGFWGPPEGWGLMLLGLQLPAGLMAAAMVATGRMQGHRLLAWLDATRVWLAPRMLVGLSLSVVLALGFLASNLLLLDPPTSGLTLHAYAATGLLGLLLLGLGLRAVRRGRVPAPSLRVIASRWLVLVALGLAVADATLYPESYLALHDALTLVSLGHFVVAVLVLTRNQPDRHLWRVSSALTIGVMVHGASSFIPSDDELVKIVEHPSLHRRLLIRARSWFDQDGDGFSARLGGGDCDDHDPTTYPLSVRGRDCLGWLPGTAPPSLPEQAPTVPPPHTLVVITIDALRCGFGRHDRPELRDICPQMTARLAEARHNLHLHVAYPATSPSLAAMLRVNERNTLTLRADLLEQLKRSGYRLELIATHGHVAQQSAFRGSLELLDDSLIRRAVQPTAATAALVTERLLERLAQPSATPRLIWAHHYDPHAPYVIEDGDVLRADPLHAYQAEVRRTDHQVGVLLDAIERSGEDTVVVLTSDHGEEFGERGTSNHGHSLHHTVSQVPFLVLRFGPHRGELPAEVPFSGHDIGRYLAALAQGRPFQASTVALGHLHDGLERQFFVVQGSWKLIVHTTHNLKQLYDLAHDPEEEHNLIATHADIVQQLGPLGALLYQRVHTPNEH